ncbi:YibE/F family protein, partial [bacterium]|nr:YibE/F family protein [bacterium]
GPISKDLFRYPPQVQHLSLKILSGSHRGEIVSFDNHLVGHRGYDILLYPGNKVLIQTTTTPSGNLSSLSLVSHIRDRFLLLLILFFLLSLVLMGGLKKGLPTALSLILTLGLVFFIMFPLFKLGLPPLLVGTLISIIAAALTLYLIGGGGVKSLSAILSTIMGVLIVGGLALLGAHFMRLNGYHMEESKTLVFYLHHSLTCRLSDLRGLLLVGIIIGGLGVMMDVAISMASSIYEIKGAYPKISQKELVKRGMNVGRDIMATMANSLILAYLGLTLPLILTFMIMDTPFLRISNWAFLDVEILAALVGSIGFILVIPLTVMITTALLYKRIPFQTRGLPGRRPFSRIKRVAIILLVLLAMGAGVHARDGGELLPESELRTHPLVFIKEREEEFVRGRVLDIERKGLKEEIITFKVLGGRYKNRVVEIPNYLTGRPQYDLLFKEGDQALLHLSQEEFFIADYVRDKFLFILAGVFVALLILIGRAKGLRTALALGITLALILFLFLPLIRLGFPPLPLSILVSILATLFTLYLVAGFGIKGHCAILGTSLGIFIAVLLSLGAKEILRITGFSSEGIRTLSYFSRHYGGDLTTDMGGILTSAIIIGALGVVMDVAITISSSMYEIKGTHPRIGQKELVKRGMNVGRDIMATMANSLILVYLGGGLLALMIYIAGEFPLIQIINTEFVALEVTRALAGSLGFVFVIPATALISGYWLSKPLRTQKKPVIGDQ